jgi:hypothetical protein
MAVYRLFCLDRDGHIFHREDFDSADDPAAIAFARTKFPGDDCELWELGRRVALIRATEVLR